MSFLDNPDYLLQLRDLLNPQQQNEDNSDLDDDEESLVKNVINPGSIGPQITNTAKANSKATKKSPYAPLDTSKTSKEPTSLEEWQQLHEEEDAEILDTRKCPTYTMTYRQAVGTEDVFLQMGNRTNASASCEDLVLNILLTDDDTPADKIQLNIKEAEVILSTAIYHLKLPLVHKVNVDRCHAKYESDQHKLILTLRLQRELDFVNF